MLTQLSLLDAKHRTAADREFHQVSPATGNVGVLLRRGTTNAGEINPCFGPAPYSFSLVNQDKGALQCHKHLVHSSCQIQAVVEATVDTSDRDDAG
jgi:hypothetical protein